MTYKFIEPVPGTVGYCIHCRELTNYALGCVFICEPCVPLHVWPPTMKELQEENEMLKARILRLEERITELTGI